MLRGYGRSPVGIHHFCLARLGGESSGRCAVADARRFMSARLQQPVNWRESNGSLHSLASVMSAACFCKMRIGRTATSTASTVFCDLVDEVLRPWRPPTTHRRMSPRPHESMFSMRNGSNAPPGSDREAGPGARSCSYSLETGKVCDAATGEQSASMTEHGRSRNGPSCLASFAYAHPKRKFCSVDLGGSWDCCSEFAASRDFTMSLRRTYLCAGCSHCVRSHTA